MVEVGMKDAPPSTEHRKLRLSCDSCHGAKVKCTKDRPSCSRCTNLAAPCVYSQSRRAGKPKRSVKESLQSAASSTRNGSPQTVVHSLPSPLSISAADLGGDVDMDLGHHTWTASTSLDLSGTSHIRRPSVQISLSRPPQHPGDYFGTPTSRKNTIASRRSLDSNFRPSFLGNADHEDSTNSGTDVLDFSTFNPDMVGTHSGLTPGWLADVAPIGTGNRGGQLGFSFEEMFSFPTESNSMSCPDFTPDHSNGSTTVESTASGNEICPQTGNNMKSCPKTLAALCNCPSLLHETLATLNTSALSFDRTLAINKTAVTRISEHLACQCLPDISTIMLYSMIVTKIVQWYRKNRDTSSAIDHPSSDHVGVTMGVLRMDHEEEHQIRIVLIRSELRKIKALLQQARERFEKHLKDGQDRQLYEANMNFLEQELKVTLKGL